MGSPIKKASNNKVFLLCLFAHILLQLVHLSNTFFELQKSSDNSQQQEKGSLSIRAKARYFFVRDYFFLSTSGGFISVQEENYLLTSGGLISVGRRDCRRGGET